MTGEEFINKHEHYIKGIARKLSSEFFDDLVSVGKRKLLDLFLANPSIEWNGFIYKKVKGAMHDELRRLRWFKRSNKGYIMLYLEDTELSNNIDALISKNDMEIEFQKAMNKMLSEREKKVLLKIFWERETLKDIAVALGVNESRVSQIKKGALKKLRKYFEEYREVSNGVHGKE